MSIYWFDPHLFAMLSLGGLGALLALTGFVQYFRGRNFSAAAHIGFGGLSIFCVGFSVAALVHRQPIGIWAGPLIFAAVYLLFFVLPTPGFAEGVRRLSALYRNPAMRLGSLLMVLVLCPVLAVLLALNTGAPLIIVDRNHWEKMVGSADNGEFEIVEPSPISTDRGQSLRVFKKVKLPAQIDPRMLQSQIDLLDSMQLTGQVIQVAHGWQPCNCHGWVFTGGHYWLKPEDVELILRDNDYHEVKTPHANDVAVYRDASGAISHTGLVRSVAAGMILVESKWGKLGRIIHPHDVHCYHRSSCAFYRTTTRVNHFVQGLPSHYAPSLPGSTVVDPPYHTTSRPVGLQ